MTEKEVGELRRRFRPEKNSITHIRGCYVNDLGEVVSEFDQSLALLSEEEVEKFLSLLRKTLSGGLDKNLLDITFQTQQVVDGEEHKLLMRLRDSGLRDDEAVGTLCRKIISSLTLEGSYLILLARDAYDVPFRAADGEKLPDASSEVYSYVLCAVCPVKMTKPALGYYVHENAFHNCKLDWLVSPPELGFLFPAFDDRSTNLYNALYYTKDTAASYPELVEAVFRSPAPMPAAAQKETFQSLLAETLDEDCRLDVVQAVHGELRQMIEVQKADKEAPPLGLSKGELRQVLSRCGVSQNNVTAFETRFEDAFGAEAQLAPRNLVDPKRLEVKTPSVTVQVDPERGDLVETRVIGGVKYLLIRADEGVEVNGVSVSIT